MIYRDLFWMRQESQQECEDTRNRKFLVNGKLTTPEIESARLAREKNTNSMWIFPKYCFP